MRKTSAQPQSTIPTTDIRYSKRYRGYLVFFHGIQHGGQHRSKADACDHAAELDAYPAPEHDRWMADHGYGVA